MKKIKKPRKPRSKCGDTVILWCEDERVFFQTDFSTAFFRVKDLKVIRSYLDKAIPHLEAK